MNWVEQEYLAVAETVNPDVWLLAAPIYKGCDHRWRTQPAYLHPSRWFSLPVRSICTRCGAEA